MALERFALSTFTMSRCCSAAELQDQTSDEKAKRGLSALPTELPRRVWRGQDSNLRPLHYEWMYTPLAFAGRIARDLHPSPSRGPPAFKAEPDA